MNKPESLLITPRELEILKLLSQGLCSNEIAGRLYISGNTVEYHRKRLLAKTATRNAAELVGFAYREGLLKDIRGHQ
ncbi:MAG: response regulator transcription factor [Prevotella sp.]